jgi:hypothetical protein
LFTDKNYNEKYLLVISDRNGDEIKNFIGNANILN